MSIQDRAERWGATPVLGAAAFVWVFAAIYHPLWPAADAGLDVSYMQALGVALLRGFVFGRDLIFAYGPLGYFWVPLFQPELFGWHFAWELLLKSLQAIIVVRAVFSWTSLGSRLLVFSCVIVSIGVSQDATAFVTIVAGVLVLARRSRSAPGLAVVVVLACTLLSLQKFTLLLLAAVAFAALALTLVSQRRWAEALAVPTGFVVLFVATWMGIGQPLSALPDHLSGSWQITSGYSAAMSMAYDPAEQRIALIALAIGMGLVVAGLAQRRSLAQAAGSGLVVAGLIVAWKAGFVRSEGHTKIAFAFAVLSPLWIGAWPSPSLRLRSWGAAWMVGLGVWGLSQTDPTFDWARSAYRRPMETWRELTGPREARARLEHALLETRRAYALPRIRERVGDASIDVLPWGVAVLFLNDLDWRPRPVFQSYSAYTPSLFALNAEHFRSDERPRFVLTHEGVIDGRHPLHDDGEAWIEILQRYEPVVYEDGFLLFEETGEAPASGRPELLIEQRVRLGEQIDLSTLIGETCWVQLEIELEESPWGALRTPFYRGAPSFLDTWFGSDLLVRHRFVPAVAERGFLIAPPASGAVGWLFHFEGVELARPSAIAIDVRHRDRNLFAPTAALRVHSLDALLGRDCDRRHTLGGHPSLSRLPDAATPPGAFQQFAGPPKGLLAHAPSELRFDLPAGSHRLSLTYAIGEGAYTLGATDGVVFSASLFEAGDSGERAGERVLFERHLRPGSVEDDRGVQSFEARFDLPTAGSLVLATAPGPDDDRAWDWSVWVDVAIDGLRTD